MSDDVNAIKAQRDELARQMTEERNADFDYELKRLYEVVHLFATGFPAPVTEESRANVLTVTIDGRVSVQFASVWPDRRAGFLTVTTPAGVRAEFGDFLPPEAALMGLLSGLLAAPRQVTGATVVNERKEVRGLHTCTPTALLFDGNYMIVLTDDEVRRWVLAVAEANPELLRGALETRLVEKVATRVAELHEAAHQEDNQEVSTS